jgi:DNA replication protein DnaC
VLEKLENGELKARECVCMNQRRSLRAIRQSGMMDLLNRYTLESYQTPDKECRETKQAALDFIAADSGWFFISGESGSGKTHICTAICRELIKHGSRVLFMPWRDESTKLKASVNDREWYENHIEKLKAVPVLYIDDFWKSKRTDGTTKVTDADVSLAFEIINARYNNSALRTVISSEMPLDEIMDADSAIGWRIYERARGFVRMAPRKNWRRE